jgi:hypothetical protein
MTQTQTTDAELEQAYDAGWHLREMGHTELLETHNDNPKLRAAFVAGWNAAAEWVKEKEADNG